MSSVTATSLADTLPSSVPKLKASGLNWAIFSLCFQDTVEAKGYWGHFDGTELHLVPTAAASPTNDELVAMTQWDKDERSAKFCYSLRKYPIQPLCVSETRRL